jgi:outer membrane lipoprotein-sorting protein
MFKKFIFISILCLGFSPSLGCSDTEVTPLLKRLEEKISGVKTLETGFIQEKKLAVFNRAVVLEGKVFIQEPDFFAWHTDKPVHYIMVIKGDIIKQWDEDTRQVQSLSLSRNPALLVAVNQMKVWFSGKYSSLLKDYEAKAISSKPIILEFTPKVSAEAFNIINKVRMTFQEDERYIARIDIEEKNQDSTSLVFINTKINSSINHSAWELR